MVKFFSFLILVLPVSTLYANQQKTEAPVASASQEPLFEAYSKIISGGVQVGFVVQRYEFIPNKKEFRTVYYMKTNALGGNITESLQARANEKLEPLHFRYTRLQDSKTKIVEGSFKGRDMNLSITTDGQTEQIAKKLPPRTFLGSFLAYVMLKSPDGIKTGLKYDYKAVAEEDGTVNDGIAFIKSETSYQGQQVFRVLNEFKGSKYVFFITPRGETLATKSPVHSISTQIMAKPSEATKGFILNTENLKLLFGSVPSGKANPLSRSQKK